MRTTLTIDDDLLAAAKSLARESSTSLGEVVSKLMRRGLNTTSRMSKKRSSSGFPVFSVPKGAHLITLEDIRRAEDEE
ncbi:MAG: antitoxin [Deltaproteobacteria bacterium]|nr:antitoxin [Deltaproteobacteria bacterium]